MASGAGAPRFSRLRAPRDGAPRLFPVLGYPAKGSCSKHSCLSLPFRTAVLFLESLLSEKKCRRRAAPRDFHRKIERNLLDLHLFDSL